MEPNNILEVDYSKENIQILKESIEKFKRVHRVDFEVNFDENRKKVLINLEKMSFNNSFLIGYYYGALEFIEKQQKGL